MGYFAVIDTETNWNNEVMSIGIAVAEDRHMELCGSRYYILDPEYRTGGMYSDVMDLVAERDTRIGTREEAMADLNAWLRKVGVTRIFAYNACFDRNHLPELSGFLWYDIMRVAAYRQHNLRIPRNAPCCSTGRLKSSYGVEPMLRLLLGDRSYRETHNALYDAVDELRIMRLMELGLNAYEYARI